MTEEAQPAAQALTGNETKDELLPHGKPGSREWDKAVKQARRQEAAETDIPQDEPQLAEDESEPLAQMQDDEDVIEQEESAEEAQQNALERMKLGEFLNRAGVPMQEFYNNVFVEKDGAQVPISKAWDDYDALKEANETLLRERSELNEKVNRSATQVQQPRVSPDAQLLANQAQMKLQQIAETDWSQVDAGTAANLKFDLQAQAQQLWQQAQSKQAEHDQKLQGDFRKAMEEADRLTRAQIPEWNDQTVRNTEWKAIGDMLTRYGIQPQEVDSVVDPRWRRFFRDALKASAEKARIQQGARKIRKVGKTVAPGARTGMAKTPTLAGARAQLKSAREQGATKGEMVRQRLNVQLPDIKPVKRR